MTKCSIVGEWAHLPAFLTGSGILNELLSSTAWLTDPKQSALCFNLHAFNSGEAPSSPFLNHPTSPAIFFWGPTQCPENNNHPPPQSSATSPPPVTSDPGLYFNHPFLQHLGWLIGFEREGKGCEAKFRTLNPKKVCLFFPHLFCTLSPCKSNVGFPWKVKKESYCWVTVRQQTPNRFYR